MTDRTNHLTEIAARATAATPGPWELCSDYGPKFYAHLGGEYLQGVGDFNFGEGEQADADREFALNARTDVDWLLAENARLRQENAELSQQLTAIRHLHKDSPMGPCPVCVDEDALARGNDYTVPYPCPTARAAGATDCEPKGATA